MMFLVLRESEYDRRTGCGSTARPGLCRGRRVTGVPTARRVRSNILLSRIFDLTPFVICSKIRHISVPGMIGLVAPW